MAKTRQHKEEEIQQLATSLKEAKAAVFANFQGLKVSESESLRTICREQNINYFVTKKTLLRLALKDLGLEVDTKSFDGGVSVVLGTDDEVAPAQTVAKFAKKHDVVTLFGGILENKFIDASNVTALSVLPSKEEILAKVVGSLNAPISGFVNVLAGNLRGLVNVLNAVKDAKV